MNESYFGHETSISAWIRTTDLLIFDRTPCSYDQRGKADLVLEVILGMAAYTFETNPDPCGASRS